MAFSKKPKKPKKPKIIREILPDEDLTALAREVIEKEKIFLSVPEPKIEFLIVKPYISKKIVARCIKANQELKYFSKSDYIIEMSDDVWCQVDKETLYVILYHELLHIDIKSNIKTGDYDYNIADHDVKDFHKIISKYGIDWFDKLNTMTQSIRELEPIDSIVV